MSLTKCYQIKIYGDVQGVGFRAYTKQYAQVNSLHGYIKNLEDGSVYLEIDGKKSDIENFIVHYSSSQFADKISNIEYSDKPIQNYSDFQVLY